MLVSFSFFFGRQGGSGTNTACLFMGVLYCNCGGMGNMSSSSWDFSATWAAVPMMVVVVAIEHGGNALPICVLCTSAELDCILFW